MTKEWEKPEDLRRRKPVLWLTMTALFMAMVVVLSMSALSIPVPGGHLYFNDVVIDTAAMSTSATAPSSCPCCCLARWGFRRRRSGRCSLTSSAAIWSMCCRRSSLRG